MQLIKYTAIILAIFTLTACAAGIGFSPTGSVMVGVGS